MVFNNIFLAIWYSIWQPLQYKVKTGSYWKSINYFSQNPICVWIIYFSCVLIIQDGHHRRTTFSINIKTFHRNSKGAIVVVMYGSWIDNYLCNQCLSPHKMCEFESHSWRGVLNTTLCDKVCDLRQVCGFIWVLWFPPPIKLTAII